MTSHHKELKEVQNGTISNIPQASECIIAHRYTLMGKSNIKERLNFNNVSLVTGYIIYLMKYFLTFYSKEI